ncbi:hypothetical protein [Acidithiobacillus sp. AMEEHan]|uniref:hypothetical protein n=1 Tax=Acidithiobacillus sp. AMEEHan TaxID=2994951 RepID=UPI0027E40F22|nr:hypothetical protein [Acidithiobacillus sp. AMEEHan]
MTLDQSKAKQTLDTIKRVEGKSAAALHGILTAPFLFLWGVIWFLGYGSAALFPQWESWVWLALVTAGVAGTIMLAKGVARKSQWFSVLPIIVVALFIYFVSNMMPSKVSAESVIPLTIGLIYALSNHGKMVLIGLAVILATMIGYFFMPYYFSWWMAIVGSTTLIGGGFFLRKI